MTGAAGAAGAPPFASPLAPFASFEKYAMAMLLLLNRDLAKPQVLLSWLNMLIWTLIMKFKQ